MAPYGRLSLERTLGQFTDGHAQGIAWQELAYRGEYSSERVQRQCEKNYAIMGYLGKIYL
jgi:hypothetical protein